MVLGKKLLIETTESCLTDPAYVMTYIHTIIICVKGAKHPIPHLGTTLAQPEPELHGNTSQIVEDCSAHVVHGGLVLIDQITSVLCNVLF